MENKKRVALVILDGWAHGPKDPEVNAIAAAQTPFISSLYCKYPNSELITWGEDVGLPLGQMGNSEVGHLNIGAGRVVYQQLLLIDKAFKQGSVKEHPVLQEAFDYAKKNNKKVHFIGLVSEGGVHSSLGHLKELALIANRYALLRVYIHAFTDGRDTDPHSGKSYIGDLEKHLEVTNVKIASVIGRYFAMDRDNRWERVKKAYDLLVNGIGKKHGSAVEAIEDSYNEGVTDEFIEPRVIVDESGFPLATIDEGDVVININFRTDRGRQLTLALTQQEFPAHDMRPLNLHYITLTEYDRTFKNVKVMFPTPEINNSLGEVVAKAGLKQLRIAETEKYPHVSFFFSGQREQAYEGETRIMIPSPKVATYDLQPEMSAPELTDTVIAEINKQQHDLIILNFANPDMVGHTGVFKAVVKAVETIDQCAKKVVEACLQNDYTVLVTADHGNSDFVTNADGTPNTAHTKNPVPLFLLNYPEEKSLQNGRLADIAPTILHIMGLPIPAEMNGKVLLDA